MGHEAPESVVVREMEHEGYVKDLTEGNGYLKC